MDSLLTIKNPYIIFLICYLIGSIPTAYLIGKIKNIDIRKVGSGNVGATNTARILGKKWAFLVLMADMAKGFLAVIMAKYLLSETIARNIILLAGVFSVLGHIFPLWLKFKGGRGVATVCGVVIALSPYQALLAFLIFIVILYLSKFVSLASLSGAVSLPASFFMFFDFSSSPAMFYFFSSLAMIIFFMHIKNIQRLINGTESKISSFAK
ncbi:MAG: glycerol-3-phosphate 1-O-acyltransferase PlsY [Spirochaetia bacterium]|nr:glycerol-3-phosphate 1-O-acyltransferase PlsY [Spirochaetia bacterium]